VIVYADKDSFLTTDALVVYKSETPEDDRNERRSSSVTGCPRTLLQLRDRERLQQSSEMSVLPVDTS
jgi:hypothetical protein